MFKIWWDHNDESIVTCVMTHSVVGLVTMSNIEEWMIIDNEHLLQL